MKIVQINAVYGVKSTGRIVFDIHNKLKKIGAESYVFWGTECLKDIDESRIIQIGNIVDHKTHAALRRIDGKQAWHSKYFTLKLCKKLDLIQPDVVHLHNLHSNYIHFPTLMHYLGRKKISVLVTLHDCWFFTGYCMHYYTKDCLRWRNSCCDCPAVKKSSQNNVIYMFQEKKILFSNISFLAVNGVSKWTSLAAKDSAILGSADLIETIYNWVDTDFFKPQKDKNRICRKYGIPMNKKIVLGVSQGWSATKGINEFYEIADKFECDVHVVLVGHNNEIENIRNITFIGYIENREDMRSLYSAADLFINPSKIETFGLVNIEALACGTPVVAYNNTGSSEIISEDCGILVESGNIKALLTGVKCMLVREKKYYSLRCCQNVISRFNKESQIEKYIKLYQKIIYKNKDDKNEK